ncbi:response regulator transcription factor [Desulfurispira natronophila]|uniref:YesN/AraC family two-component response regulator n=1 Tax=Desulfurispira natronophila TaxID=682562 RepID=A0A7W8DG31_9BACT|nr:response regulator [Desulfurispira natronophila]MBB5020793.1 YesN/AraC family two-component response regulator [Desulfurispira natronophila]
MSSDNPLKDKTVLVVEDDLMALHNLSRLIGFRCKKVYQAKNGKEGLENCAKYQPDIVVTDLEMPVMSGMQMLETMKDQSPQRPVVVVTAFDDEDHLVPRADAVLVKPLQKNDLFRVLEEVSCK